MNISKLLMTALLSVAINIAPASARPAAEWLIYGKKTLANATAGITNYFSAFFTPANGWPAAGVNLGLKLPVKSFYLPNTINKSWFVYVEGTTDFSIADTVSGTQAILSNCSFASCTGGNDRVLQMTSHASNLAMNLQLKVAYGGTQNLWQAIGASGASVAAQGSGYPQGYWPWTASVVTGSCATLPSGYLTVGTNNGASGWSGNTIKAATVTQGGSCAPGTTLAVNSIVINGQGTGGSLTVTMSSVGFGPLGIQMKAGQHWCGVVGQYGVDAGSLSGQQYAAFVDDSGNPLPGSPILATTVNNTNPVSGANFYYSAPNTLRTNTSVADIFTTVGVSIQTGTTNYGWGDRLGPIGMIWGVFPNNNGAPSSVLGSICQRQLDPFNYFKSSFTLANVRSFFTMNSSGSFIDLSSSNTGNTSWGAATPITAGYPILGAANVKGTALTLKDSGPYTTYPITNFTTGTGPVFVSGTYSASLLGGNPPAIQAQISATPGGAPLAGCATCAWSNIATPVNGTYSGTIVNVPAGLGPYYISVRPSNLQSFVVTGGPMYVGLIIGWQGQSQMALGFAVSATGSSTGYTIALPAELGSEIGGNNQPSQNNQSQSPGLIVGGIPLGEVGVLPLNPMTINATVNSVAGDTVSEYVLALSTISQSIYSRAFPIQLVNLTRSGSAVETWIDGYMSQSVNLQSASVCNSNPNCYSVPWTAGNAVWAYPPSLVGNSTNPGPLYAVAAAVYSSMHMILAGTTVITVNGVQVVADVSSPVLGTSVVACSGVGVTYCQIDYVNNLVSVAFASPPVGTVNATWTSINDLQPAPSNQNAAIQYDGQDFIGNGANIFSGYLSNLWSHVPNGLSAIVLEQCTANESEFVYASYDAAQTSMTHKYDYLFGIKYPTFLPNYKANTPIVSLGYPGDVEAVNSVNQMNGCAQWTHDYGSTGGFHFPGGSFHDISIPDTGPHETAGVYSGQRLGLRAAINTAAALFPAFSALEPTIAAATFDNTTTYNPACAVGVSSTAHVCFNVTFNIHAPADALRTCGANFNGGAALTKVAAGPCTDGGIGQHVEGFRIGTSLYANAVGNVLEDGLDPVSTAFSLSKTFSCSQVAAAVVQCVKYTGTWTSGSTYFSYGEFAGASRTSGLVGNLTGAGYTITNGGAGYTNGGPYTITASGVSSGLTCQVAPTLTVYVTGGAITSVFPATSGQFQKAGACLPVFTFTNAYSSPSIGTPTTPATVNVTVGSSITDNNIIGQYLYDNSGAKNALLGTVFNGLEVGLPVTPTGLVTTRPVN